MTADGAAETAAEEPGAVSIDELAREHGMNYRTLNDILKNPTYTGWALRKGERAAASRRTSAPVDDVLWLGSKPCSRRELAAAGRVRRWGGPHERARLPRCDAAAERGARGGDPWVHDQHPRAALHDHRLVLEELAPVDGDPVRDRRQHATPTDAC